MEYRLSDRHRIRWYARKRKCLMVHEVNLGIQVKWINTSEIWFINAVCSLQQQKSNQSFEKKICYFRLA